MTTADDLKTALGAWVDEKESNISDLKSGLGSMDAAVSALQTELASEQADVANIKSDIASLKASVAALTPAPPAEPPPPPPPAIAQDVQFWDGKTEFHGGKGHTIAVILISGTLPSYWKQDTTLPLSFGNGHAGGPHIFLDGCDALYCAYYEGNPPVQLWPDPTVAPIPIPKDTLWPDGKQIPGVTYTNAPPPVTMPPPTTTPPPSTTPPPVTTPPATGQVSLHIDVPPAGSTLPDSLSVEIVPDDASIAPIMLRASDAQQKYSNIKMPNYGIEQYHWRTVSSDKLWQARFMPDVDGSHLDIGLRYGSVTVNAAKLFGGFTANVRCGDTLLGAIKFPYMQWCAEERFSTGDRPDVRTVAQLVASNQMPGFKATSLSTPMPTLAKERTGPMSISDVEPYMGQTGGRADIGYFHERSAAYLGTQDAGMRRSTRIWAEVANAGPWHVYDDEGRAWDFQKYPNSTIFHSENGTPPLYMAPNKVDGFPDLLQPDSAHYPNLSYPEAVLSGDPWHVRNLLMETHYIMGIEHGDGGGAHIKQQAKYGPKTFIVGLGQERESGWDLRLWFLSWIAAQEIEDETLPSADFFKLGLDHTRDFLIEEFVNNTEARCAVFHTMPHPWSYDPWMQDMFNKTVAIMERSGRLPDWQPIYDFCAAGVKARRDPTSGANINHPTSYNGYGAKVSFTPDGTNKGTMGVTNLFFMGWPSLEKGAYNALGAYRLKMVDATNYTLTTQDGRVLKGQLGTTYNAGLGLSITLTGTPEIGDGATFVVSQLSSWAEFDEVNQTAPGYNPSITGRNDYSQEYLGAMLAFSKNRPDIAALVPDMIADMAAAKLGCGWKYSFEM